VLESDTVWSGPIYFSTSVSNTNLLATWGLRQPTRFRVGLVCRTWANSSTFASFGGRVYMSYRNFYLNVLQDPAALPYHTTTAEGSGATSLALSPPRYLPYTFSVAARSASGALSAWTPAAVGGVAGVALAVMPYRGVMPAATQAKLNLTGTWLGYQYDFSAERPRTRSVNFVRDSSWHATNFLVQDTAAFQPTITGSKVGDRSSLTFLQDSFLEAIPFFNYVPNSGGCCAYTIDGNSRPGGYNWLSKSRVQNPLPPSLPSLLTACPPQPIHRRQPGAAVQDLDRDAHRQRCKRKLRHS